ncbi:MAG: hypothetical protein SF053_10535 [Bacteroidia bacterium]|nr:hypothetical protein [Bacteroidia bacterium]
MSLSTDPVAYSCVSPASGTFAGACTTNPFRQTGCPTTCTSELWFRYDPSDINSPVYQHSVRMELTVVLGANDRLTYTLLYSESKDNGFSNPCAWSGAVSSTVLALTPLTNGCMDLAAGTTQFTLNAESLDGNGTFFLKLERESGTGGTASVCLKELLAPQPPPVNDRCADALAMSTISGGGIDPLASFGGSGSWGDALDGTNRYATKQRRDAECAGAFPNEDHYFRQFGVCYPNFRIGDKLITGTVADTTSYPEHLSSTVFYTFSVPAGDPLTGWYLHVGQLNCPDQTTNSPDSIEIMVASNLDCNNAQLTTVLGGGYRKVGATGLYPTSDLVMALPALTAGITYGIIVDGVKGSNCDYKLLLTRNPVINPVLPAAPFRSVSGYIADRHAYLTWTVDPAVTLTGFDILQEVDGQWQTIHTLPARTDTLTYTQAVLRPAEHARYQVRATGPDGAAWYSELVSLTGTVGPLALVQVYPVPADEYVYASVMMPRAGLLTLQVLDLAGRIRWETQTAQEGGLQTLRVPVEDLPAGMYLLRARSGGATVVHPWTR